MTVKWAAGVVLVTSAVALSGPSATTAETGAELEPVVARYLDRVPDPLTSYRAHRRLEASGLGRSGWLEAWTVLENGRLTYAITAEGGEESVRERVLRKVLASEQQAWTSGEAQRSGITPDNYRFVHAGDQPGDLVKVLLKPRRKGKLFVDGAMFLERDGAELVRVEGRLTSNPSFWISRVNVSRRYQSIAGHNLPVEVRSVADLRFAGDATFHMMYRYTHVNGRPLGHGGARSAKAGR